MKQQFSPQSALNDTVNVILVLLSVVEHQHAVHLVRGRCCEKSSLRHAVNLTLLGRLAYGLQGVLLDFFRRSEDPLLQQPRFIPVIVAVEDCSWHCVPPLELAEFSTGNCRNNN
jgi:hypothetical protein